MATLRTPEGKKKYKEYLELRNSDSPCPLCNKELVKDFNFWKVIDNKFPYDKIAKIHHMLIPKRHAQEKELNSEEIDELSHIKESYINPMYDWIIEPTSKNKSIPDHFHLHLIIAK